MIPSLDQVLRAELDELAASGLRRELRRIQERAGATATIGGHALLNFSSNDYLGLATHPALAEAAARAATDLGSGSAASRLVCGSLDIHHELEAELAAWEGSPACLAFSSGFAAALGTIPALVGPDDVIILDKLSHACLIDAARLSTARLRVFRHNDLNQLAEHLRWADSLQATRRPRVLVVTESVFSMDGDTAPLPDLVKLKDHHGAWLFLDEAHGTGLFGPARAGLADHFGLASRIDVRMGTLGKAVGSAGGFIAGSTTLIEFLVHRARSFVFSTAPVPAAAAAACAGVRLIRSPEGLQRCTRTWSNAHALASAIPGSTSAQSPIIPWILGTETDALDRSLRLRQAGILAPAIRYPTVPRNKARIRFTVSAEHTPADLAHLAAALQDAARPPA